MLARFGRDVARGKPGFFARFEVVIFVFIEIVGVNSVTCATC